jgi:hypothetical protein
MDCAFAGVAGTNDSARRMPTINFASPNAASSILEEHP